MKRDPARDSFSHDDDHELAQARAQAVRVFGLSLGERLGDGLIACVCEDGVDTVLRLHTDPCVGAQERIALHTWRGGRAPRLLAADEHDTALLLERIRPGDTAVAVAPREVAAVLADLHVAPPAGLPSLHSVVSRRLEAAAAEVTAARLDWAVAALERRLDAAPRPMLLHGAFLPDALVRCNLRGLCATAPSPCSGDPAYDVASWIHAGGRPGRRARFDALAGAIGIDPVRLRDWCGIVAVHG